MRRISEMIDVADALGLLGLLVVCAAAWQFDPRWPAVVIGVALILLAIAYSRPQPPEPAKPVIAEPPVPAKE